EASFSIPANNSIRFGLSALKGVGLLAANNIIESRKRNGGFSSINEFLSNVDQHFSNKKVLEALIQGGALDSFGFSRKCLFESVDSLSAYAQKEQERKSEGQGSLFMGVSGESYALNLPKNSEEWEADEKLKREKLIAGLFLSGHPLDKYKAKLKIMKSISIEKVDTISSGSKVELAGIITKPEVKFTRKNDEFMNFKLEDFTGEIDCTAFPKTYAKFKELIKEDQAVFIRGVLDKIEIGESDLRGQVIVNSIEILNDDNLEKKLERALHIKIDTTDFANPDLVMRLYAILTSFKGNSSVFFHLLMNSEEKKVIKAHPHYSIEPTNELLMRLTEILGDNSVFCTIGEELKSYAKAHA
ncbi:MAG: DNA polymerase III subunit alpha, partial [Leptospira sp.]|nr:DNA polymerase III subunit alpha [Leptospira sp.]